MKVSSSSGLLLAIINAEVNAYWFSAQPADVPLTVNFQSETRAESPSPSTPSLCLHPISRGDTDDISLTVNMDDPLGGYFHCDKSKKQQQASDTTVTNELKDRVRQHEVELVASFDRGSKLRGGIQNRNESLQEEIEEMKESIRTTSTKDVLQM